MLSTVIFPRRVLNPLCLTSHVRFVASLREILEKKIKVEREKIAKFRKESGKEKVGEITVNSIYGGMRGLTVMICETSLVDAMKGITYRGLDMPSIREKLPKFGECGEEPLPEAVFWLLLTGEVPTAEQAKEVTADWNERAKLPKYLEKLLKSMPPTLHPMSQLSIGVTALNHDSKFLKNLGELKKPDYWECFYEDAMDLIAKIPSVAAAIYRNTFHNGEGKIEINKELDWSGNFVKNCGFDDEKFMECMRLYFAIHADHEGGNVSAHTVHCVGSALSDCYISFAAGLNGLAGPLHGLANQQVVVWLQALQKEVKGDISEEKVKEFVNKWLKTGRVVPGYGHAVLRMTDPRYTIQYEFVQKHLKDNELAKLASIVFKVVPPILKGLGKVQNPWPNVDAMSGVLLQHYGMKEMNFYTVLFGVSRAIGTMAMLIWSRALGFPIERPKSITTEGLINSFGKSKKEGKKCK